MVLLAVAEALDGALLDVQADQVLEVNPRGDLGIGVVVEVLVCAVAIVVLRPARDGLNRGP